MDASFQWPSMELWHKWQTQTVDDFQHMRFSPATVTILLALLLCIVFACGGVRLTAGARAGPRGKPRRKKKKKVLPAEAAAKAIADVRALFDDKWLPGIELLLAGGWKEKLDEDREYLYKYYEEMMLKELMALDGVDTLGAAELRELRRDAIKYIQGYQKQLDKLRSEWTS